MGDAAGRKGPAKQAKAGEIGELRRALDELKPVSASRWEHIWTHTDLRERLAGIEPDGLRCLRMMGTFLGAAGSAERQRESEDPRTPGLVDQMATTLFCNWDHVQSMLLLGSCNRAVPVDQAPYQYYTYLFVARVVHRLMGWLQKPETFEGSCGENSAHAQGGHLADQLALRFTFVPEDILFAQFFFDEKHLIIAASYSWNTLEELHDRGAYAAFYMDNRHPKEAGTSEGGRQDPELRFPRVSRRLVQIFDARFREQAESLGEEVWTLKRLSERDYGVLVETPFWRETSSVLRAYQFGQYDEPQAIELGANGLQRFIRQIESQIGPSPPK